MKPVFFCAVGGSGMMPLALIVKARGVGVRGSDRSRDQGRTPARFAYIEKQGIPLFPQDGSGITEDLEKVVVSAAVEETVPDYRTALAKHIPIVTRAQMLADLFNATQTRIAVAGTSGKSTTTGMIGWILHAAGLDPTIVNGASMKNFASSEKPFASAVVGGKDLFVAEVDESDGSIDLFNPSLAVLNNLALDHKTLDELRALFARYVAKAPHVVINLDNAETARLAATLQGKDVTTYSLSDPRATLHAENRRFRPDGVSFDAVYAPLNERQTIALRVPGDHNVANALAALGAALAAGVSFKEAARALENFQGMARRLDVIGTAHKITVIDDFAHNPDKITASLACLHQFEGRLLILFQMHGFGPLKKMWKEFVDVFSDKMEPADKLFLPQTLYLGGTDNRTYTSADLAKAIAARGRDVTSIEDRDSCAKELLKQARQGDRIVVMGARDDTLTQLAQNMLRNIQENQTSAQ